MGNLKVGFRRKCDRTVRSAHYDKTGAGPTYHCGRYLPVPSERTLGLERFRQSRICLRLPPESIAVALEPTLKKA